MKIGIVYNSFNYKKPLPEEKEMRDTGLSIGKHLSQIGHHVEFFDMDNPEGIEKLCASKIDVAFNACERIHDSSRGEAYAAALLEFLDIPHTRTRSWLISLGISKERVKSILMYHHIATPRYQVFHGSSETRNPDLIFPLFVKGLSSENSIGIDANSLVYDELHLKKKVDQIVNDFHQPALVEEYIDGREFSVAILPGLENQVLPISEIVFHDLPPERRFLDYDAKWFTSSESYQKTIPVCPANISKEEGQLISETALKCFNILSLDSYARIDLRYRNFTPYILEVNQNPSISEEDSGYVRTCEGVGVDYLTMIHVLLRNAIVRKSENLPVGTDGEKQFHRGQNTFNQRQFETTRI